MKVIILGSKGMLGQIASSFFSQKYETICIDERYLLNNRQEFISKIINAGEGYVINCIGKIKQKSEDSNELFVANSILPLDISNSLTSNQLLIQPSTDCVFSGATQKWYSVEQECDAKDDYGYSKRLGEVALMNKKNSYIIRVSIIGPDRNSNNPKGLLGWFLKNSTDSLLDGYANHFWNGITTLEWCKKVEELVFNDTKRILTGKIIQLGTEEIRSKFELLQLFQKVFQTNFKINSKDTELVINRTLKPEFVSKDLEEQLIELNELMKI
ncbi:MAG: sugar nucleotide-binding protein [Bacteroidota bacterium]